MYWEDYGCVHEYLGVLTYSHSPHGGVARVRTVLYLILGTVQYRHNCLRCTAPWAIVWEMQRMLHCPGLYLLGWYGVYTCTALAGSILDPGRLPSGRPPR